MWDERTKCDKCGEIIEGGRIRLIQHKNDQVRHLQELGFEVINNAVDGMRPSRYSTFV
jgi:hypothetical protein